MRPGMSGKDGPGKFGERGGTRPGIPKGLNGTIIGGARGGSCGIGRVGICGGIGGSGVFGGRRDGIREGNTVKRPGILAGLSGVTMDGGGGCRDRGDGDE
jgi:hypothetical protein